MAGFTVPLTLTSCSVAPVLVLVISPLMLADGGRGGDAGVDGGRVDRPAGLGEVEAGVQVDPAVVGELDAGGCVDEDVGGEVRAADGVGSRSSRRSPRWSSPGPGVPVLMMMVGTALTVPLTLTSCSVGAGAGVGDLAADAADGGRGGDAGVDGGRVDRAAGLGEVEAGVPGRPAVVGELDAGGRVDEMSAVRFEPLTV